MTWAEFVTDVKELLPADADRAGLETYVNRVIRQGVINIQSDIPVYRTGHETTFGIADLAVEGSASVGTLPEQAEPRDLFYVKTDDSCIRQPVWKYEWSNRYDLICGKACLNGCQFAIAFSPQASIFYVYPAITEGKQLAFFWDGRKLSFADSDTVPFDEGVELAVSLFASAQIARKTNHEIGEYNSYMAEFIAQKRRLYLDAQERTRIKEQATSTAPTESDCSPCPTCNPCAIPEPEPDECCGLAILGSGSPEGVVTAEPGRWYVNTDTNAIWLKLTGTGNTGWLQETGPFDTPVFE